MFAYTYWIQFNNGEVVTQYKPDGSENSFDYNRFLKEAKVIRWVPTDPSNSAYTVELDTGAQPILHRRTYAHSDGQSQVVFCIGYMTADGEKVVTYIQPPCTLIHRGGVRSFEGAVETFTGDDADEAITKLQQWITTKPSVILG